MDVSADWSCEKMNSPVNVGQVAQLAGNGVMAVTQNSANICTDCSINRATRRLNAAVNALNMALIEAT